MKPAKLHYIHLRSNDFNTTSFLITETHFKNGEHVKKGDLLAVAETSKKTIDIFCDADGFYYSQFNAGDEVKQNQYFAVISHDELSENQLPELFSNHTITDQHISLKAQKYIKKFSIHSGDLKSMPGEVKVEDVLRFLKKEQGIVVSDYQKEIEKYENMISPAIYNSYVAVEFSHENLVHILDKNSKALKKEIGVDALFCYCVHKALASYPKLSSYIDGRELISLNNYPVGIYVSDGNRAGETFVLSGSMLESLSDTVDQVYSIYKSYIGGGPLTADPIPAGLFISNLMFMNVSSFVPLLKKNTCTTLGIGSLTSSGKYNVGISFDHRLIDGYYAAQFLNCLKNEIETGK